MARVSKKALRPRSYVLGRLTPERLHCLRGGVRKLLEKERLEKLKARAAVRAVERTEARRHAENILAGVQEAEPGNEQLRALGKELNELRQKKLSLFAALKKKLDDAAAAGNDKLPENGPNRAMETATKSPIEAKVHQTVRANHAPHSS
ncbi:hypothetical protein FGB62_112g223 [Gracilaria domingensis]|nr:hypothetical protein FGB62_112g223 [Gracilaria domingensis]